MRAPRPRTAPYTPGAASTPAARYAPAVRYSPATLCMLAALCVLAGCQTLAPIPPTPWPERRAALQAIDHYRFTGALAAANGTDGFSASLRWRQQGEDSDLLLRAPLGVGGAQLDFDGTRLRLAASDGAMLQDEAARAELVRLIGFEPPLASLRYWLLGAPYPAAPTASETIDDAQRLAQLQQQGWQIDYGDYLRSAAYWLPQRVTLRRGALRLKLRLSNWRLE